MFEEHELVERIVPLHQEDSARQGSAQIFVSVVRVAAHAALGAAFRLGHLGGHAVLLRHKLLRYLRHCVH